MKGMLIAAFELAIHIGPAYVFPHESIPSSTEAPRLPGPCHKCDVPSIVFPEDVVVAVWRKHRDRAGLLTCGVGRRQWLLRWAATGRAPTWPAPLPETDTGTRLNSELSPSRSDFSSADPACDVAPPAFRASAPARRTRRARADHRSPAPDGRASPFGPPSISGPQSADNPRCSTTKSPRLLVRARRRAAQRDDCCRSAETSTVAVIAAFPVARAIVRWNSTRVSQRLPQASRAPSRLSDPRATPAAPR